MMVFGDLDHNGELTKEELNKYLDQKNPFSMKIDPNNPNAKQEFEDLFTEEQKAKQRTIFEKADVNNDGVVTATEAINYGFQHGGRQSVSQDELTQLYGGEKAQELMKFDKDGDGKLNANEFNEATTTKEKGFFDKINFKDPKVILAIVSIAVTVIGIIIGLCVYLSRKNKKKKEEQAKKAKADDQQKSEGDSTSASTGNLAEQVRTPISPDMQQLSNETFSQYTPSHIDNQQQPLSLNDSRRSTEISM